MKLGTNDISKIMLGGVEVSNIYLGTSQVYEGGDTPTPPAPVPYSGQYLTIESLEDDNTVYLKALSASITKTVSASTDNGATWTEYTSSTDGSGTTLATLNAGDKLLVKGENTTYATSSSNYNKFISTGQFEVKGNIMSLIYGDNFSGQTSLTATYTFYRLFTQNEKIISAENLVMPATTLTQNCYQNMFFRCANLTTAPSILPATTLETSCYRQMFQGCTSLTVAPELSATTLAMDCYRQMFQNCTSLTTAPELPATTLASYCYGSMFYQCTSLNYIKCLSTDISAINCTNNWVDGVAASGTFVKSASMSIWTTGTDGIPTGWTVEDAV